MAEPKLPICSTCGKPRKILGTIYETHIDCGRRNKQFEKMPAKYELEHVEDPENGDVRIVQVESRPELTKYAREVATESPIQAIGKELAFKLCDRIDQQQAEIERLQAAAAEAKLKRGQFREIIEALLVPTNFISIEAARDYITEALENYGLAKVDQALQENIAPGEQPIT